MSELEWKTRKERIDKRLRSLPQPWIIIPWADSLDTAKLTHHAVEEYPTANGPADYALFVDGKLLGIIEAKKVSVGPQNVLEQAKRYSLGAGDGAGNWNGYRVPFLYATNGEIIWFVDVRQEKLISRKLAHFHTPHAIRDAFQFDQTQSRQWLKDAPVGNIVRIRPYQENAITHIEEAMMDGQREMLVAMATGTGKTFTTVAQIYRLLASGAVKKVLFLVDRKALAAQAVREFSAFTTPTGNKFSQEYEVYSQRFRREDFGDEQPFDPKVLPESYLTNPQPSQTFVYVSTIQRMAINLFGWQNAFAQQEGDPDIEEDASTLDIPIHAFDLIIADECHRGYTAKETSVWRDTIQHFDAIKVGLTATPAAHTVALFGEPVFRYGVEQAIQEGHLVDYQAVRVTSNVRMNGVFLREGEQVGRIDTETGEEIYDELEDERAFDAERVEREITSPDSNKKLIKEIAGYACQHEKDTGRFPKILIFAQNDRPHTSHADSLVTICRKQFDQGDGFVQKITGNPNVDRPLQRIREFRNRPQPKVVVTVDMLSTGVDIPALEYIVFMRPVKSRILWEQMLGRGTRKCGEINKSHFTIFDCFGGTLIEYFKDVSNFKIESPGKEPIPIEQVIDNIYQNIDRPYFVKVLVKRLQRIEKDMSAKARQEFSKYIPTGDMGVYATGLSEAINKCFTPTMELLRNKDFQYLLVNYERAKRVFIEAIENVDEVSSERVFRVGKDVFKPQDYLTQFALFVQNNRENIDAIKILLERPKDWSTSALEELRVKLRENSYPEDNLQVAHDVVYHKPLADIISMIKHAAQNQAPIMTAKERVWMAMEKVTEGKTFTEEQTKWLEYIADHLVGNLTVDAFDLDNLPVFTRHGGLTKAKKVFQGHLEELLSEINLAVAA